MKDFKRLRIWQKGMEICRDTFKLVENFPTEQKFGLCTQMTRAAVSIPANIAEGSSRRSEKEYCRYIEIALGSCFELETLLLIVSTLHYGEEGLLISIQKALSEEIMMIHIFGSKLKS